jgi:nitronate monooxygenase
MDATRRDFLTTAVTAVGVAATHNLAHADDHEHDHSHESVPSEDTMISTRLTERFGIRHPIICAPMGFVAGGVLAAAVSRAGGLGLVGGGSAGTLGGLDLETELARAKSGKFGVGFITWALARAPEMLTKALRYTPFCVFLSFGDPRPFAAQIRNAGAALICQVQFLSQIDMALEAGASAVVVQGTEAGGHGATNRSTFPFVPEAADYLKQRSPKTLLIAAGGIADGRGLAAALMLGADGVVVGSRLWASAEALTPKAHTDKAIGKTGDSTIRTKVLDALRGVPWPREYSFRILKNKLTDEWADREAEAFRAFGTLSEKYAQARAQNDLDTVAVVCGEAVGLLRDRPTAESIVKSMAAQAADLLRSGGKLKFKSQS